jgi:HAD superfamily hydrolase (TIGR01509 family)
MLTLRNDGSPEGPLRAIIIDFNGVIADDEPSHLYCFQQALAEQGLVLSREDYYQTYLGMDERTCTAALLLKRDGIHDAALQATILERKAALFRDYTASHKPALFPWVIPFIQRAAGRYRLAIASGGRREQILAALDATVIEKAFELMVTADECRIGKPEPAIYEFTLRQLNARYPRPPLLKADECLVIEDSRAGILAGRQAGMRVLGLSTTYPATELDQAHLVLPDLDGVEPAELACRLF